MFVLDELDKLFEKFIHKKNAGPNTKRLSISLADVPRIDITQFQLSNSVGYPIGRIQDELTYRHDGFHDIDFDRTLSKQNYLTLDLLFTSMMRSFILPKLVEIPERQYSSARLMICDNDSYDAIMKLQRVSDKLKRSKYFLYRRPSGITAIFLLQDIIDIFDRVRRPLVIMRENYATSNRMGNFDYSIIKQVFPFLKMTDLVVILTGAGSLNLKSFNVEGKRDHQVLQFLSHFARSAQLIDLQSINKQIGHQHPLYNNVSTFWPLKNDGEIVRDTILKPPLTHLSYLASQVVQLTHKMKLNCQSISYRAGDPYGSTRTFAQIFESMMRTRANMIASDKLTPARVFVIDRFFDLQGPLYHSDTYGAFIEQEIPTDVYNGLAAKSKLNLIDDLDDKLQSQKLTDALSAILNYTVDQQRNGLGRPQTKKTIPTRDHLTSNLPTSQSIRKHMDIIKIVFKFLKEGYLLILKLEACLRDIYQKLRSLSEPLSPEDQDILVGRLKRAIKTYSQLIKLSGSSIRPINLIRVACILIDVINIFVYVHSKKDIRVDSCGALINAKTKLLSDRSLSDTMFNKFGSPKTADDQMDDDPDNYKIMWDKLRVFDKISWASCENRATLSFEELIERFLSDQLDQESYPKIVVPSVSKGFATLQSKDEFVILVILGSVSCDEVSRIKLFEQSLKSRARGNNQSQLGYLCLLTCGTIKPRDYLISLK